MTKRKTRKKLEKKNKSKINKKVFIKKMEIFFILLFIFALFLFDVNANLLAQYGVDVNVPVISTKVVAATSMFWLGFIIALISFFAFSIGSIYRKTIPKKT